MFLAMPESGLEQPAKPAPLVARGVRRWLLLAGGFVSLALGAIGVVLPLLPTTPFVLLAAYFFARSSPAMHQRLLQNRVFGPLIEEWSEHRAIPRRAKLLAISMIVVFGGISIVLVEFVAAKFALGAFFVIIISWLATRPTSPAERVRSHHRRRSGRPDGPPR